MEEPPPAAPQATATTTAMATATGPLERTKSKRGSVSQVCYTRIPRVQTGCATGRQYILRAAQHLATDNSTWMKRSYEASLHRGAPDTERSARFGWAMREMGRSSWLEAPFARGCHHDPERQPQALTASADLQIQPVGFELGQQMFFRYSLYTQRCGSHQGSASCPFSSSLANRHLDHCTRRQYLAQNNHLRQKKSLPHHEDASVSW